MPDYRRYRVPGGTYFFTINLFVGAAYRTVSGDSEVHAGDDAFSNRIKAMKTRFVQALPPTGGVHRYERQRVNVASGNDVFGSIFGTREIMRAIWTTCTATRSNMATCRWLRTGPIDISSAGEGRCLSTRLRWRGSVGYCCRRAQMIMW